MSSVQRWSAGVQIIILLTLPCDGRLTCVSTIYKATQHEMHRDLKAREDTKTYEYIQYKTFTHSSLQVLSTYKFWIAVPVLEEAVLCSPLNWQEINKRCKCCSGCAYSGDNTSEALLCCRLSCLPGPRKIHPSCPFRPSGYSSPRATKWSIHWNVPQNCLWVFQKCHFLMASYAFFPPLPVSVAPLSHSTPPWLSPCPLPLSH